MFAKVIRILGPVQRVCARALWLALLFLVAGTAHAADGDFLSARTLGGGGYSECNRVAVDDAANVCVTGDFSNIMDLDPVAGKFSVESAGDLDVFVLKLDPSGALVWAKTLGGTGDNRGLAIAVDREARVFAAGQVRDTVDVDPGAAEFERTSAGGADVFVLGISGPPDETPPRATAVTPATTSPTNASEVSCTVVFDEPVINFNNALDVVAGHAGTGSTGVTRAAVLIDQTASAIALSSIAANVVTGPILVNVWLTEPSMDFVTGDVNTSNADVRDLLGSGDTYNFTLTPIVTGVFSAYTSAGVFTEAAGNASFQSGTLTGTYDTGGEGEVALSEIAEDSLAVWDTADLDDSESLSLQEARAVVPVLRDSPFASLDTNDDDQLSRAELQAALMPLPECACPSDRSAGPAAVKRYMGEYFLLGLLLLTFTNLAWIHARGPE